VASNLRRSRMPFPFDASICYKWREGLYFERSKERILYTSCMYQMAHVIGAAAAKLEKFSVADGGMRARLAALGAKAAGGLLLRPDPREVERAGGILRNIYAMLKGSGVTLGVLESEPYSGALLYELGFVDDFAAYARRVYESLKSNGVREVVTTDPHTQYILEKIYPRYVERFDLKVTSYLNLIDRSRVRARPGKFVVHDSCYYSRYLDMRGAIRGLLRGARLIEHPTITGKDASQCCGGPVESTYPGLARAVAASRLADLSKLSRDIVVECPICYANLQRANEDAGNPARLYDLAEVLGGG